jgi:protein TonB
MFDDLVESTPGGKQKTKKPITVFISFGTQLGLVALMLIIPLLVTPALPKTLLSGMLLAPPPPAAPPPPPAAQVVKIQKPQVRMIDQGRLVAPKSIPKQVALVKEEELPPDLPTANAGGGVVGGVPGGMPGGALGSIVSGGSTAPPPPPPPPAAVVPKVIPVGGDVQLAKRTVVVQPVYPRMAMQMHIQGTVRLHAIISTDGRVTELNFVSGPAQLVQAAMDAVRQWRFSPTTLNNTPVQVECQFDVKFVL